MGADKVSVTETIIIHYTDKKTGGEMVSGV